METHISRYFEGANSVKLLEIIEFLSSTHVSSRKIAIIFAMLEACEVVLGASFLGFGV
jgi:hypothetical protein